MPWPTPKPAAPAVRVVYSPHWHPGNQWVSISSLRGLFEHFASGGTMEKKQSSIGHGWAGKAASNFHVPNFLGAFGRPDREGFALVGSIAARPEELRPIFSD